MSTRKWTAIFLLYTEEEAEGDNVQFLELQQEIELIKKDIMGSPLNDDSKLLVIYREIVGNGDCKSEIVNLFEVTPKVVNGEINNELTVIAPPFTKPNFILSAEGLGEILRLLKAHAPAEHYLLFTWGHGSIFGIYKNESTAGLCGEPVPSNIHAGQFRDMLTNEDLASAIATGFDDGPLDILLMINCFAQNTITQFALKGKVKYLVAPQSHMGIPGYHYKEILAAIFAGNTPDDVARVCLTGIHSNALRFPQFRDRMDTWSVFAFNLQEEKVDRLFDFISRLGTFLQQKLAQNPNSFPSTVLDDARARLYQFDGDNVNTQLSNFMIDLRNLLFFLKKKDDGFVPFYLEHETIVEEISVSLPYIGSNCYSGGHSNNKEPSGISVYFPRDKQSMVEDDNTFPVFVDDNAVPRSLFFEKVRWYQFLQQVLDQ
jgi:hypothetical protein